MTASKTHETMPRRVVSVTGGDPLMRTVDWQIKPRIHVEVGI